MMVKETKVRRKKKTAFGLEGIKVIETASALGGPMASRLLADWGADVIHVEHPIRGDMTRSQATGFRDGRSIQSDIKYMLENHNRNKRGITINLSQEGGREILYKLLEKADVFVNNFRPRELKKFRLEYEILSQLNPRLVQANVTGYGRKGPDRDAPGYEQTGYFARSGMLHVLQAPGTPPLLQPVGLGDYVAGLALALGIMTTLFLRTKTGVGREVDVSLFQTGVFAISNDIAGALVTGQDRQLVERQDTANVMNTYYETKDGRWLRLGMTQPDPYWSRFCRAIEREDLEHYPRFETLELRIKNHVALFHILEAVFLARTLDEWKVPLNEMDVIWAPVQTLLEAIADPQSRANDFFVAYDHPTYGRIELVANPIKFGKTPETIRMPAPEFGQHTEEVLLEYGYTWDDIARFKEQGVIA